MNLSSLETDLAILSTALDIVVESSSVEEMCRRAVLNPHSKGAFVGCHIYLIDRSGQLAPEAHFGKDVPVDFSEAALSACFSGKAIFTQGTGAVSAYLAIPLESANLAFAVVILVLEAGVSQEPISARALPLISKLVGHHLNQLKTSGKPSAIQTFSGSPQIAEITTRQVKILEFMAEGLTNAEISRKLLLSESTVRQESVRIYRIFNTDSRQAAVAAGREAGLIANLQLSA